MFQCVGQPAPTEAVPGRLVLALDGAQRHDAGVHVREYPLRDLRRQLKERATPGTRVDWVGVQLAQYLVVFGLTFRL